MATASSTENFNNAGAMRSWHANEFACVPDADFSLSSLPSLTPEEALYCIYILLFKKLPNNMADRAAQGGVTCLIEYTGGGYDNAAADARFVVRWRAAGRTTSPPTTPRTRPSSRPPACARTSRSAGERASTTPGETVP